MPTVRLIPVIPGFYRSRIRNIITLYIMILMVAAVRFGSPELIFHETAGICPPVSDFQLASSGISSGFPDVSMFPRRHLHLQPADFH